MRPRTAGCSTIPARGSFDLERTEVVLPSGQHVSFPLDGFSRHCLMEGVDQLGYLLGRNDAISRFEKERRWQP